MRSDPHRHQLDGRRRRLLAVSADQANELVVELCEEGRSIAPSRSSDCSLDPLSVRPVRLQPVRRAERRRGFLESSEPQLLEVVGITGRYAANFHSDTVVRDRAMPQPGYNGLPLIAGSWRDFVAPQWGRYAAPRVPDRS